MPSHASLFQIKTDPRTRARTRTRARASTRLKEGIGDLTLAQVGRKKSHVAIPYFSLLYFQIIMRRGLFSSTLARPRPLLFRPVSSRGFFSAFKAFFSPEKSAERYETLQVFRLHFVFSWSSTRFSLLHDRTTHSLFFLSKKEINKGYFYDYTGKLGIVSSMHLVLVLTLWS